jgi:hypothetical protein
LVLGSQKIRIHKLRRNTKGILNLRRHANFPHYDDGKIVQKEHGVFYAEAKMSPERYV